MESSVLSCADARHLVHLSVGDDTGAEDERQLTDHLHGCSDCRAYHAGMVDAMHVLENVRDEDSMDVSAGAVWNAISHRIQSRPTLSRQKPAQRTFNGSVAALCACSLTLALVTVVRNLPTAEDSATADFSVPTATSVSFDHGQPPASSPTRLVPVQLENGDRVLMNPSTGQMFVPNLLHTVDDRHDVTF